MLSECGESSVVGIVTIVVGVVLVMWHTPIARAIAKWQRTFMNVQYGPIEIRMAEAATIVIGIGAIVIGILMFAGVGVRR